MVAAAAAKLAFIHAPTAGNVNPALAPTVTVATQDTFGNTVSTNSSNVTITINTTPAGAVLTRTLTQPAINGIATFSNLKLSKPGAYKLKVTDGVLTAVISPTFNVI